MITTLDLETQTDTYILWYFRHFWTFPALSAFTSSSAEEEEGIVSQLLPLFSLQGNETCSLRDAKVIVPT